MTILSSISNCAASHPGQLLLQAVGLLPAATVGAGPLFQIDISRATPG